MLQSGHSSRDRRTDGQTDGVKPIYPPTTSLFGGYNYVQKYIATGRLNKVFVDYVAPNPTWISLLYYDIYLSWISWICRDKHGTFCLFCKMVINKTILLAISLSNRSCSYEFTASIDCWLKTSSHYNVITPSTVSTTQNAKLLPSPNLCHSLMLCHVIRSQRMGECGILRRPTSISRAI